MRLRSTVPLGVPHAEIEGTRLTSDGTELRLEYAYVERDGHEVIGTVRFVGTLAHRFEKFRSITVYRDEPWITEILCAVGELGDSPWVASIERVELPPPWPFVKRHYVLALGDVGLFEVIADHFEVLAPVPGSLSLLSEPPSPMKPSES
jgi:hypothetical protein